MSTPALSVIVPTKDRARILARHLDALAASEGVAPHDVEVLVIDDGSDGDETARVLDAARDRVPFTLVTIRQPNAGQAAARNRAMADARAPIWLFLNDDTIATPRLLAEHLATHAAYPDDADGVLGRVTLAPEIPLTPARALHLDHMWARLDPDPVLEWHNFWTTNVSVKASFLTRHALVFDPEMRFVHDDTEFGLRLHEHGFRLHYAPAALGYHDHPIDVDGFLRMASREATSLVRWAEKRPDRTADLARFGYTPAKAGWERCVKFPLLAIAFNRATTPLWVGASNALARACPSCARFALSQCYAARKRRTIRALRAGRPA